MPYLFHGQRSSEEVVLLTKQHPIVLLRPMLISVAFLLIPFFFNIFLNFNSALAVILILFWTLGATRGFLAWYSWNNSIALLTTERVVVLLQKSATNREFSECGLQSIQQVSHEVKGLLRTFFGFGTISIYTGGSQVPFSIPNVPEPYELQQEIQRAVAGEGFIESNEEEEE